MTFLRAAQAADGRLDAAKQSLQYQGSFKYLVPIGSATRWDNGTFEAGRARKREDADDKQRLRMALPTLFQLDQ